MLDNEIFQIDSESVKKAYQKDNYLIEFNDICVEGYLCAIYFSSNDIYYPNNEENFRKRIIEKDFYEMYNTRINNAYKHIFIRDVQKQWYLNGINTEINSPEKLFVFLQNETNGYNTITLGSSSGGYAAVLYGQLLNSKLCLSFNGQFMLSDLLQSSTEKINPLVFRLKNDYNINQYYSLRSFIKNPKSIFYFNSNKSSWDLEQLKHVDDVNINVISFKTSHHGIPFLKVALRNVINIEKNELIKYTHKINNPLLFTIKMVGLKVTFLFLNKTITNKIFKK